jgi:hypothetical protein
VSAKLKVIGVVVSLLAVFLLGFIPQFLEKRRVQNELEDTRMKLSNAQRQMAIAELPSLAGRMLLAASRQNYGIARDYSSAYFEKVRELAGQPADSKTSAVLAELMKARDSITRGLAQGDASIVPELQSLLERTYQIPEAAQTAPR